MDDNNSNLSKTALRAAAVGMALLLAACGGEGGSMSAKKGARPDRDAVKEIRDAGRSTASSVEVAPLRDPAVDGFLKQAADLEAQRKFAEAVVAIDRALKLAPDAPEILQLKAELLIALRKSPDAEALARKSFDLGPKLGSLCARNWATIAETRRAAKDEASAESAKAQLASCKVPPRQRL